MLYLRLPVWVVRLKRRAPISSNTLLYGGDRCPEAWGSRPLGPTAEMFIVDARTGTIGDEQLSWVVEAVTESHRTWKVGRDDNVKRSPTAV